MSDDQTTSLARLFVQAVPEIAAGVIEIKGIARRPGLRSKVALCSRDPQVDCIGGCVGSRGCRIMKIVEALGGVERIDLVRWDDTPENLIRNALQPAAIEQVTLHPARHRATVVVKEDQMPIARGRRGVNRELASRLCGWEIELVPQ